MRRLSLLASFLIVALASAAPAPVPAKKAVEDARAQAKREGKNVMVVYHASWCGWCKRFDAMLQDPKVKPQFDRSYVIVHLDVMESGDKKALENPGGDAIMKALGGEGAGLPFFAVVDPGGKKLGDSLRVPGDAKTNTGHPAAPEEVAAFMALLEKTAKKTDAAGRVEIETYLKAQKS